MLHNLAVGTILVALTVLLHMMGLIGIASATPGLARSLRLHENDAGRTLLMTAKVIGLFALLTLEVWLWAEAYNLLGTTHHFEDALILSTESFSTLGSNNVDFDSSWRLLTALEGMNGFLMIGWSTAYLVRASTVHGPFRDEHF